MFSSIFSDKQCKIHRSPPVLESRFSILRFSYDEKDDFTTGFSSTGKGQNQLASDVFKCITTGINVKFIVPDKMAEYQEIKSFNLPYMK